MLGWMIIFAFFAVLSGVISLMPDPSMPSLSVKVASVVFGVLFVILLAARVVRGRA